MESRRLLTCFLMDTVTVFFFFVSGASGSHMAVQTSIHNLEFMIYMG